MKKRLIILGIVVLLGVGGYVWLKPSSRLNRSQFEFVKVEKGPVVEKVTATGTLQPINVVSVGTQVSGIIEKVLVDYNDEVEKG